MHRHNAIYFLGGAHLSHELFQTQRVMHSLQLPPANNMKPIEYVLNVEKILMPFLIPKRLEVKAASGKKGIIFHKFSVRNSGASSGDVGKLRPFLIAVSSNAF